MNTRKAIASAVTVACIGYSGMSHAFGGWSGNTLVEKCRPLMTESGEPNSWDLKKLAKAAECIGFIQGVMEGTLYTSLEDNVGKYPFCVPTRSTPGQDAAVVIKYLKENPSGWHLPAGFLVRQAFSESFPCKHK